MKRVPILTAGLVVWSAASCLGVDQSMVQEKPAHRENSDPNNLVTLEDYLRYAAMHNAGLKAGFERWRAELEQIPQAKALPDPRFTYSYFMREIETRVGPQKHKLGVMQTFPWLGEIEARVDAAVANAKAAGKEYEAAKLKLFYEVKNAFYEYAYLARAVQIAEENLELIRHFEQVTRTQYKAAAASHPDVIRAQMEMAKLEDRLNTLREMRHPLVARLNAALNRPPSEELPWPERPELRPVTITRSRLIETLKANNPQLGALDFKVAAAKDAVELAENKFYPDIGVGLDWIQTDDRSGVADGGTDPIILMFSLNLPLWRDSYKAAREQARANVRRNRQEKTELENTLLARTERCLFDFEDNRRKARLYGHTLIPKAQELLTVSETAYKAGTIDFLSLVDAQRMLLRYQLQYERAVTSNLQKLAELEMLAGTELTGGE